MITIRTRLLFYELGYFIRSGPDYRELPAVKLGLMTVAIPEGFLGKLRKSRAELAIAILQDTYDEAMAITVLDLYTASVFEFLLRDLREIRALHSKLWSRIGLDEEDDIFLSALPSNGVLTPAHRARAYGILEQIFAQQVAIVATEHRAAAC